MQDIIAEIRREVGALVEAHGIDRAVIVVDVVQKLDRLAQMIEEGTDNGNHPD